MTSWIDWLAWDALAVSVIALLVLGGARKGFARKLTDFLGVCAAAVGASFLSRPAALWLYDVIVRDAVHELISRRVAQSLETGLSDAGQAFSAIPEWASRMLSQSDVHLPQSVGQLMPAIEGLIDSSLAQPVLSLLRGVCFFVMFTVFSLIAHRVSVSLGRVNYLPLVGPLNATLGGVLGIGEAMLILYCAAVAARIYIAYTGGGAGALSPRAIEAGYLFSFFYRLAG